MGNMHTRCRSGKASRGLAMVLAVLLFAGAPAGLGGMNAAALTEQQINDKLAQLQKEQEKLEQQIKENSGAVEALLAQQDNLREQISVVVQQIDGVMEQLEALDAKLAAQDAVIAEKEQAIEEKQAANQETYDKLKKRLRAIDKTGNLSAFQMLMDTEDYADYLIKSKLMERIAESDQQLIDTIDEEIRALNREKEQLGLDKDASLAEKAIVEGIRQENEDRKQSLDTLYQKLRKNELQLQTQIKQDEAALKKKEAEEAKLEEELRKLGEKGDEDYDGKYTGGTMFWPVPAVKNVFSPYGIRKGKLHKGIDISSGKVPVYGQDIVAAADGVVIFSNYTNTWGSGYGYYTMVDHGKDAKGRKIVTLYAHCSKMYARVGDKVVGGKTVLALAGDTGDVTGPHLHFEVRVNGTPVDPIANGYVKLR